MNKEGLQCLIGWLEEIQKGDKDVKIPYGFHELVRLFHNNWGTTKSLDILDALLKYKELE